MTNIDINEQLEKFCAGHCTAELGWSKAKRTECREHSICRECAEHRDHLLSNGIVECDEHIDRLLTKGARQRWQTPDDFFSVVDAEFRFCIDVAADDANAKCKIWINEHSNALVTEWFGPMHFGCGGKDVVSPRAAWCNPGFSNMRPWVERAYEQTEKNPGCVACVLGPLTYAPWLSDFCRTHAKEIRIITPRIQFVPPPGVEASTNRGDCVLVVFYSSSFQQTAKIDFWNWRANLNKE